MTFHYRHEFSSYDIYFTLKKVGGDSAGTLHIKRVKTVDDSYAFSWRKTGSFKWIFVHFRILFVAISPEVLEIRIKMLKKFTTTDWPSAKVSLIWMLLQLLIGKNDKLRVIKITIADLCLIFYWLCTRLFAYHKKWISNQAEMTNLNLIITCTLIIFSDCLYFIRVVLMNSFRHQRGPSTNNFDISVDLDGIVAYAARCHTEKSILQEECHHRMNSQ